MSDRYEDPGKERANETTTPESKYPYNHVYQTAGGIRVIVGNEPGKEALKVFHPSGSYVEFMPNGKVVSMNIGENKQYNKGGVTITVDENNDVHIKGHSKLQVGGGTHIEVAGDAGIIVGGTAALAVTGDLGVNAKNIYMGATGNFNLNVEGNSTIDTKGNLEILVGQNTTVDTKQTTQFDSGQNHNTNASNIASVAKEGTLIDTTGGDTNVNASGDVKTMGATTKIQGGGAGAPPTTFA